MSRDGTISLGNSGGATPADPGAGNADLSRTPASGEFARPTTPVIAPLSAPFTWGDYNGDGTVSTNDWPLYAATQGLQLGTLSMRADFDGDFDVDDWDLDRIADNAGMTGATWADGDLDGDGTVTADDLDLARLQFDRFLDIAT